MTFDRKNIVTIGLCVSIGLNVILSFFIFQDKFLFKSAPMQKSTLSQQEEKKSEPTPVQETKLEPKVRVEKEYEVLIPEVRKNDPSNDGWMTRKWSGVYSNSERKFFSSEEYIEPETPNPPPPQEVNMSIPNTFVVFENEELSLRLPFDEKWGDPLYKFEPYIVDEQVSWDKGASYVSFGRITYPMPEGGVSYRLTRPFSLIIRNSTGSDVDMYVTESARNSGGSSNGFKLVNIPSLYNTKNTHTVLEYFDGGLGTNYKLVFFGDKYTYTFSIHEFYRYSYDDLEDIISTIELK